MFLIGTDWHLFCWVYIKGVQMTKVDNNSFKITSHYDLKKSIKNARHLIKLGNFHEALLEVNNVLKIKPKNIKALKLMNELHSLIGLSNCSKQRKKFQENTIGPNLVKLLEDGNYDEVEKHLLKTLDKFPKNSTLWLLLGDVYGRQEKYSLALQSLERSLLLNPSDPDLYNKIGSTFMALEKPGDAYRFFQQSLIIDPNNVEATFQTGMIYNQIRKSNQAFALWSRALELDPKNISALTMLGIHFSQNDGNSEVALDYFERALKEDPTDIALYNNVTSALMDLGRHDEAINIFETIKGDRKLLRSPGFAEKINFCHGLALLSVGRTDEGWKLWWDRVHEKSTMHSKIDNLSIPRLSKDLAAKSGRLLVLREQGIGDQIYLLGSLKKFAETHNFHIILEVCERTLGLMKNSFPDFDVITTSQVPETAADYWMAYGDLPHLQGMSKFSKGISEPYIINNQELVEIWKEKLPQKKITIGLSWRSGDMSPKRVKHYTHLNDWEELINMRDVTCVCLQYSDISKDLETLTPEARSNLFIPDIDLTNDFENLGAIIANCDLVIGPSSAPIHQSSASGTPTVVYTLRGNRYSLGKYLEKEEYSDVWYSNCKNITFRSSETNVLVKRCLELVEEVKTERKSQSR